MNSSTEVYLHIANVLPVTYLVFKTGSEINNKGIGREVLRNWIVLVSFLLLWDTLSGIIEERIFLSIGAMFKIAICLFFDWLIKEWNELIKKQNVKKLYENGIKKIIRGGEELGLGLIKLLIKYIDEREKNLLKEKYLKLFDEPITVSVSPPSVVIETPKQPVKTQIQQKQTPTPLPIVNQIQIPKIIIQKQIQQTSVVKQNRPVTPKTDRPLINNSLLSGFDLKRSTMVWQDIASPTGKSQNNNEDQVQQIKRMNTFSHQTIQKQSSDWSTKLNISISQQYSMLLGSDDEGSSEFIEKQKNIVHQKKQKLFVKKQVKPILKQQENTLLSFSSIQTEDKPHLSRAQIYLQTGNSHYKLQRKILKLYENDEVHLFSTLNILIETFKLLKLRPLRSDFYELKAQANSSIISKIFKFRGEHSGFTKYVQGI